MDSIEERLALMVRIAHRNVHRPSPAKVLDKMCETARILGDYFAGEMECTLVELADELGFDAEEAIQFSEALEAGIDWGWLEVPSEFRN